MLLARTRLAPLSNAISFASRGHQIGVVVSAAGRSFASTSTASSPRRTSAIDPALSQNLKAMLRDPDPAAPIQPVPAERRVKLSMMMVALKDKWSEDYLKEAEVKKDAMAMHTVAAMYLNPEGYGRIKGSRRQAYEWLMKACGTVPPGRVNVTALEQLAYFFPRQVSDKQKAYLQKHYPNLATHPDDDLDIMDRKLFVAKWKKMDEIARAAKIIDDAELGEPSRPRPRSSSSSSSRMAPPSQSAPASPASSRAASGRKPPQPLEDEEENTPPPAPRRRLPPEPVIAGVPPRKPGLNGLLKQTVPRLKVAGRTVAFTPAQPATSRSARAAPIHVDEDEEPAPRKRRAATR